MRKSVPILGALLALALVACAQTPPPAPAPAADVPTTLRGTVQSLNGQALVVATREGPKATVMLAADTNYRRVLAKHFSDIKVGDFVGATTVTGKDGKPHAVELHIFTAAQSAVPKSQRPWDLRPDSTMTNAIVSGIAKAPGGAHVLTVTFGDKSFTLIVDRNTPVVTYGPGDVKLVYKGRHVLIMAVKKPDGTLVARNVTVEYHGVKPPM
ncbi:MAG TPA: hypothetical protein VMQ63_01705 [Stellaceae bacterium]|nr:hypothetical protein [Stellaceae bacterium]